MSTKLSGMPVGQRAHGGPSVTGPAGSTTHLPPLASHTVGGGVKVQQLFEDKKPTEIITNGNHKKASSTNDLAGNGTHLPSVVRPASSSQHSGHGSASGNNKSGSGTGGQRRVLCLSPESAMKQYMPKLSSFEQHEIFTYSDIYFVGANAKKRQGVVGGASNAGYDDEQGSYIHVPHDHVSYRYEVLKVIGKGSFGQVSFQ